MGNEQRSWGSPCLKTPAPQHLSALLPSEDSVLREKSNTSAADTAIYLPATQALLPAVRNKAASSFGFAKGAADTRKQCFCPRAARASCSLREGDPGDRGDPSAGIALTNRTVSLGIWALCPSVHQQFWMWWAMMQVQGPSWEPRQEQKEPEMATAWIQHHPAARGRGDWNQHGSSTARVRQGPDEAGWDIQGWLVSPGQASCLSSQPGVPSPLTHTWTCWNLDPCGDPQWGW